MRKRIEHKISGTVEEIVFRHSDNGFTVLKLSVENGDEPLTVVGVLPNVARGEELDLEGSFTSHPSYGKQFRAVIYSQKFPTTPHAIEKYLSSGTIKGLGPTLSCRIVDTFGEDTLNVIQTSPEKLTQVKGVSDKMASRIYEDFMRVFGERCIMSSLKEYGLDAEESFLVLRTLGSQTLKIVKNNPYVLARPEINLDFKRIDEIAGNMGIYSDDERRLQAGCVYVLNHNLLSMGHSCLPYQQLLRIATAFLGERESKVEIALSNAIENEMLCHVDKFKPDGYVYLPELCRAEQYIVKRISQFAKMASLRPKRKWNEEIFRLNEYWRISYDPLQTLAIERALNEGFLILSGGPGTGKTTTLNAIITLYKEQGLKVAIAAPTGRAAKRIFEMTKYEAKTIHRLLQVQLDNLDNFYFLHNENNPLDADVVIIDEFSMVDLTLFESLLLAIKPTTRLILVGDADQLPSVTCGCILSDFMKTEGLPVVELAQVFRQSLKSLIIRNAHDIRRGDYPRMEETDNDFFFINEFDPDRAKRTIGNLILQEIPEKHKIEPSEIQVLCPSKIGFLGTVAINAALQEKINPPSKEKQQIKFGDVIFREGDRVIQTKNDYKIDWRRDDGAMGKGVFNGDIGIIEKIDSLSDVVIIRFDDKVYRFPFDMLIQIEHAYAITVHKSQGSEYKAVILPLMGRHPNLHFRKLLYTAVTRAKKLLIIVGDESTVDYMVDNHIKNLRYSTLSPLLEEELKKGTSL